MFTKLKLSHIKKEMISLDDTLVQPQEGGFRCLDFVEKDIFQLINELNLKLKDLSALVTNNEESLRQYAKHESLRHELQAFSFMLQLKAS